MAGAFSVLLLVPATAPAQTCPNPPDDPVDCAPPPHGKPVPFKPDTGPVRVRKSGWALSAPELAKYQQAWAALRKLTKTNPKDPRGWMAEAKVHCWQCGGGSDGTEGQEIHGSWMFFPWHRAYLYYMERILGKMVNDPTLALPYWDWDDVNHRTLPPPFVTPNDPANSLYDELRGVTPTDKLPLQYVGPVEMKKVLSATDWTSYMGTPQGPDSNGGSLENGPHGVVHLWTGKPSMDLPCGASDMGVLSTAGLDPIFFTHHANIDRLWDVWLQEAATHTNPPYKSWLDITFTFFDENGVWRSIKVSDVVDHDKNLHYVYAGAKAVTKPAVVATKAAPPVHNAAAVKTKVTLTTEAKTVPLSAPPPTAENVGTGTRLHIEGIEVPESEAAVIRVFLGKPDATAATSSEDPHYVGYFSVVPKHGAKSPHHHGGTKSVVFDLPADLVQQAGDLSKASVTLVPMGSQENAKARAIHLSFSRVYVTR